jgi:hypothetical protein
MSDLKSRIKGNKISDFKPIGFKIRHVGTSFVHTKFYELPPNRLCINFGIKGMAASLPRMGTRARPPYFRAMSVSASIGFLRKGSRQPMTGRPRGPGGCLIPVAVPPVAAATSLTEFTYASSLDPERQNIIFFVII